MKKMNLRSIGLAVALGLGSIAMVGCTTTPKGAEASGPTADRCIAMGYVATAFAEPGTRVQAIVRGKPVPMEVSTMPFVPTRYYRG